MSRRHLLDVQWPEWMADRMPLDRWDRWLDFVGNATIDVEEFEKDNTYIIRAEVPGIDPDKDVDLSIADGALRLKVQRTRESFDGDRTHFRSEFEYGSFQRYIMLPTTASATQVTATYKDGILEIAIPLTGTSSQEQRIAISRG